MLSVQALWRLSSRMREAYSRSQGLRHILTLQNLHVNRANLWLVFKDLDDFEDRQRRDNAMLGQWD